MTIYLLFWVWFDLARKIFNFKSIVRAEQKVKAVARKNISRFIALDKIKGRKKKTFSLYFFRDYFVLCGSRDTHLCVVRAWVDLSKGPCLHCLTDRLVFAENF